ncbi:MAG: hypothetical protein LBR80_08355, partial [Deltaproteobacteria bacterium]|nr:hypothetical protein [Deltaproteobacteria bacterium]
MKLALTHLKKFLVEALIAGSEGLPLPSLVNPCGTVDPKFHEEANETFRSMKILEAEAKKAYDAELKMFDDVRPFGDGPESPAEGDGQETTPSRKRRSRAVRPGCGPPKSVSEDPEPSVGRKANGPGDPRSDRDPPKNGLDEPAPDSDPAEGGHDGPVPDGAASETEPEI